MVALEVRCLCLKGDVYRYSFIEGRIIYAHISMILFDSLTVKARGGGGGRGVKKFDFLIFCLWTTQVEADLVEPKLATKQIALTQKMRFTFFIEI